MRLRLTIITTCLVFFAVLIMGGYSAWRERRLLLKESIEAKGQALITSLLVPCRDALGPDDSPDHQRLDRYLDGLTTQEGLDVIYATVLDEEGRVVSHTDPERFDERASDAFAVKALASSRGLREERFDPVNGRIMEFSQPLAIEQLRWGTLIVGLSVERVEDQLRAAYLTSMGSAFLIIGPFALFLYLLFSRQVVRPVLELARGVRQVGDGDLSTRVQVERHGFRRDELSELLDGFNVMVDGLRERERLKGELAVAKKLEEAHTQLEAAHRELEVAHKDLTRVHEALKQTQGQLIQAEKMAALGSLVAGVAHEINNPINYLVQSIDLVREHLIELEEGWREGRDHVDESLFSDLKRVLEIMTDGAERTAGIVKKLRDFSRKEAPTISRVALDRALDANLELLRYEMKGRITVERRYDAVDAVEGDPAQLTQVFLNLLNNAVQAIREQGRITVRLTQDERRVQVEISDTGQGIRPDHLPRIFDPFFTTKEVGKGTGLGLSLSYQIVQRHGGDILVESEPGAGAIFKVRLPRPALRVAEEAAAGAVAGSPDGDA